MTTERRKTDPVVHARDCWRVYGTAVRPDGCEGHDFIDGIQQDIEPDPLYDALIAARDLEGMLHALRQNGENETDDCGNEIPAVETLYWALRGYLEWQGTSLIREEPKSLTMAEIDILTAPRLTAMTPEQRSRWDGMRRCPNCGDGLVPSDEFLAAKKDPSDPGDHHCGVPLVDWFTPEPKGGYPYNPPVTT